MKHTEKYLQARFVTQNPDKYDNRDVVEAEKYCKAYLDGYIQAVDYLDNKVKTEIILCSCDNPNSFKEMEEGKEICSKCGSPY